MASEQTSANEAKVQAVAEATRATIEAMAAARAERTQNAGPRLGRPVIKQPTFNWEAEDRFNELRKLQDRGKQHMPNHTNIPQTEQLAIIQHWLDRKGLQFLEYLTQIRTRKV